mgnify:CR=1 FL=1
MKYWKLPNNKSLAFVPRAGSTAWSQAIMEQFYPYLLQTQKNTLVPSGKERASAQFILPFDVDPYGQAHIVLRNPIERFISGYSRAANNMTVDELIDFLINNEDSQVNVHIRRIIDQFGDLTGIKMYKWETDLEQLRIDIGLYSVPTLNISEPNSKPTLTNNQIEKLNQYYADDIRLWDFVTYPGKIFNKTQFDLFIK